MKLIWNLILESCVESNKSRDCTESLHRFNGVGIESDVNEKRSFVSAELTNFIKLHRRPVIEELHLWRFRNHGDERAMESWWVFATPGVQRLQVWPTLNLFNVNFINRAATQVQLPQGRDAFKLFDRLVGQLYFL